MGRRGPKKTPTLILRNRGSWLAKDRSDVEVSGSPRKPRGMSKEARKHWNDLVPQMSQMGILAYIDWPKLYRICYLWAKIKKIEADAEKDFAVTKGKVITKPDGTVVKEGGNVIYNPAASRLDKLWDKYLKLTSEFCMGPVHRAGMGGIQKKLEKDEKSRFFNKNA